MTEPLNMSQNYTRRNFIKNLVFGGGSLLFFGKFGVVGLGCAAKEDRFAYSMIVVDYDKCTGCRTCETVCSAYNHQRSINGEMLPGLGNPHYTNIRVYGFNPDVDVPAVCAMCPDAPCIAACPVEPHPKTGRRALYRDDKTFVIKNDIERCIGCGRCAEACRVGVIIPNPVTSKPERMCTLCGGDPQCVKYCPYGALSHVKVDTGKEFYGMKPEQIAEELIKRWYKI